MGIYEELALNELLTVLLPERLGASIMPLRFWILQMRTQSYVSAIELQHKAGAQTHGPERSSHGTNGAAAGMVLPQQPVLQGTMKKREDSYAYRWNEE